MNAPQSSESTDSAVPSADPPCPGRDHRWGFGAFFLAEGVFLLASVLLGAVFGLDGINALSGFALLAALALPTVLAGAVAIVISMVRGNGPRSDFGLRWHWPDVATGLAIGVVGLVSTTIASVLWSDWVGPARANSALSDLLNGLRLPPGLAVLVFLHVWLVAPVCGRITASVITHQVSNFLPALGLLLLSLGVLSR